MQLDLRGKNALVGGASKGIGKAVAYALSGMGACVTLVARSEALLSEITYDLDRNRVHDQQDHDFLLADFDRPKELRKRIKVLALKRPYHILVNNTGGPPGGPITEAEGDAFVQAFQRHLLCNQILSQAVLPAMKKAGYGRIINIISTSVKAPIPNLGVSNTIRGAVANWAKTWANEVGRYGITVNNVLPGATATERLREIILANAEKQGVSIAQIEQSIQASIPIGRFAEPKEIAQVVAFLASPAASYITGTNLTVDGGRTPSW